MTPTPSLSVPTTRRWWITDDYETYREEVMDLAVWRQDNNLSLNVGKTKELIADCIDGAVVVRFKSFKFLGVHITKDLSWSKHTNTAVKRGTTTSLPTKNTEKIWHGPLDPQNVIQQHH